MDFGSDYECGQYTCYSCRTIADALNDIETLCPQNCAILRDKIEKSFKWSSYKNGYCAAKWAIEIGDVYVTCLVL